MQIHRCRVVFCAAFVLCVSCSLSVDYIPLSWGSVCDIYMVSSNNIDIICNLSANDDVFIDFNTLDFYTRNITEEITYGVEIRCSFGGNLSMPWPMKIDKLIRLKVEGCVVYDFMAEWNMTLENTPDTLQSLTLADSVVYVDKLMLIINSVLSGGNMSRDWNCGHDTSLRKGTFRNVSVEAIEPSEEQIEEFKKLVKLTPRSKHEVHMFKEEEHSKISCRFVRLEYVEHSFNGLLNSLQMSLMNIDARYPKLMYINYTHSVFANIPSAFNDWPRKYSKLKYIDFSDNFITRVFITNTVPPPSENDTILDVRRNNITIIDVQDIRHWANLEKMFVDIRENPLDCSCSRKEFIQKVQGEELFVGNMMKYKYIRDIKCATPISARGQALKDLNDLHMGCPAPPADLLVPLVVVAIFSVILIIFIVLSVKYRKEIKIIMYTRFDMLLPGEVDDSKDSKKYAAFVAYSSGDGGWVHDYLQTNIESPSDNKVHSFKLCLHERDFILGMGILDNIIYSIENSRHTIVILSRNFLQSVWGVEEFTQAYYESIAKKRRHLILVKLEDIPESEMPSSLQRCLKTFTYLDAKDKMFLDRLRYSLAIKSTLVGDDLPLNSDVNSDKKQPIQRESSNESDTEMTVTKNHQDGTDSQLCYDSGCVVDLNAIIVESSKDVVSEVGNQPIPKQVYS